MISIPSRAAIKAGIKPRDHGSAQAIALTQGRATHPTKDTKLTSEVKKRISEGVAADWASLTPEQLEKRSQQGKDQWESMTVEERKALLKLAGQAVRKASKDGSRLENFLKTGLTNAGFIVEYHKEGLIPNQKLQIDLFIPELMTAIEIDGPSHFLPIWGQENLQRNIRASLEKTGLLIAHGFVMIRVKQLKKNVSKKLERDVLAKLIPILHGVKLNFPGPTDRLIEIEG